MSCFTLIRKTIILVSAFGVLVSCASPQKNTELQLDKDRMAKTAKINSQLGIAYLEQNNIQRAKQKLLLAISQDPTIPEPWYSMGYFLEATGDKKEAKTYYLKAIALAPNRGDAHNNYGTFLCRSGDYSASIDHFMLATKDSDYLDVSSAYENAGLCAMKIPDHKLATHYFEQALMQDPTRQTSLYKLAEIDYETGNYSNAKKKLNEFLMVAPPTTQTLALAIKLEKHFAPKPVNKMQSPTLLASHSKKNKTVKMASLHSRKKRIV